VKAADRKTGLDQQETQLLKPAEAAAMLAISRRLLWSLSNRGDIPVVRIGRLVRYAVPALERWIAEHSTRPKKN
jgi:excisionase family DNA binding protein